MLRWQTGTTQTAVGFNAARTRRANIEVEWTTLDPVALYMHYGIYCFRLHNAPVASISQIRISTFSAQDWAREICNCVHQRVHSQRSWQGLSQDYLLQSSSAS